MQVCTELSTIVEKSTQLNASVNNGISVTDLVPDLDGVFYAPATNLYNINPSTEAKHDDYFIEDMDAFLDTLASRTDKFRPPLTFQPLTTTRKDTYNIRVQKICNGKVRRYVSEQLFQETGINTAWSDGTKQRTTMDLSDGVEVHKEQLTVLDGSQDIMFCRIERSTRTDRTLIQM